MASANTPPSMRAAQWRSITGGIENNLKITNDAKLPKSAASLPRDHTLVKVAYASLNHLDYKVAEMPLCSIMFSKPATPGLDFSGTVVSTTLGNLKPGQRVLGRTELPVGGTLAEYVVVGKPGITALPDGVTLKEAACVGICGTTAVQCLVPFLGPGKRVLINGGSGGVGIFAIQVAKAAGCSDITVVCSESNADLCRSLGASKIIDYNSEDLVAALTRNEELFDHILDTVFLESNLYWKSHHYLKPDGTYVSAGLPPRFKTFKTLFAIHVLPKWLGGGKRRFKFHSVSANPGDFTQVAQWIEEKKVKAVIENEFDLEDVAKAYSMLKAGKTRGKIVVRVGGDPSSES